jgi:hypothetical protein
VIEANAIVEVSTGIGQIINPTLKREAHYVLLQFSFDRGGPERKSLDLEWEERLYSFRVLPHTRAVHKNGIDQFIHTDFSVCLVFVRMYAL